MIHTEPRVLLDATAIPAERGGVGRYVDNLAAALDRRGAALSVVCQSHDGPVFAQLAPGARIIVVAEQLTNRAARLAWEQTTLPRLVRKVGIDVIHSPHYTMPLAAPVPVVVTLHDATFFSDKNLHVGVKARFFRGWTRTSLRRAAVCVVPSEATAAELARAAGAKKSQLVVAMHGVDSDRFNVPTADQKRAVAQHLELGDQPWVAFLGTLEPRKNVPALIRAFTKVAASRSDAPALVLAGSDGWDAGVEPALAAVPEGVRVIKAGHLPADLLPGFLGGSDLVVYPSLGEGFGLPVLEAMACGAAVLTTRRLSLPEVGGDAVAYTGTGAGDIAAELARLLDDPAERQRLGEAAVQRAGTFTWDASAEAHQVAFRRAAESV